MIICLFLVVEWDKMMRNICGQWIQIYLCIITVSYTHLAIQYIQDHLCESIRVTEIAQTLGVSTSVLYKAFMSVLDIPPVKYIHPVSYTHLNISV